MYSPIYEHLEKYYKSDRVSFAMPGHKNGRGLKADFLCCDVTELDATVNLRSEGDKVIGKAQEMLAELYGSDESYILTCGSTAGIQAMLACALSPGDTLLVSGDCHMSVINTCALCGYKIRFLGSAINPDTMITYDRENPAQALTYKQDVDAVLVTSPNYYGMCRDIKELAAACHRRGIPLLVDEAHGAHFIASDKLPESAIRCGADAVVNSAHKTLNALTGAAYLHVKSNILNKARLRQALGMFQTSSPSYPIAASADMARAEAEDSYEWERTIKMCNDFKRAISENTFIHIVENDDPTRIVLNFSGFDISGYEAGRRLAEEYGIDVEMSDVLNIVLIATPSNTQADFNRLFTAMVGIYDTLTISQESMKILPPPDHSEFIDPQRSFYSKPQAVALAKSFGRISAATVTAYPPGIPVLCMGEMITAGHVAYLRHLINEGAVFTGFDGEEIFVL